MDLELKHLAPYLPYGLQLQINFAKLNEVGTLKAVGLNLIKPDEKERLTIWFKSTTYENGKQVILPKDSRKSNVKPLLMPLYELTNVNWLDVFWAGNDKVVKYPPDYYIEIKENEVNINYNHLAHGVTFYINELKFESYGIPFNQLAAFNELFKLHADLNKLIDAGLALNKKDHQ